MKTTIYLAFGPTVGDKQPRFVSLPAELTRTVDGCIRLTANWPGTGIELMNIVLTDEAIDDIRVFRDHPVLATARATEGGAT